MSQKRRDNKKRVLRDRESQCKDGRYRYSYLENGKRKDVIYRLLYHFPNLLF